MSATEKRSPSFITGSRHMGRSCLVSIQGYSTILRKDIVGEMSDTHRKALRVIFECCEIPAKNWTRLSELIELNEDETVMETLMQVDDTGQSHLERNFIRASLAAMETAKTESSTILQQGGQLTDEQQHYVEIILNNCQREIEVWKEIAEYFS